MRRYDSERIDNNPLFQLVTARQLNYDAIRAQSKKPHADRKLRRQWKMLAGENQVGISPIGSKLGLDSSEVL